MAIYARWYWKCYKCGAEGGPHYDEEEAQWGYGDHANHKCEKGKVNGLMYMWRS